eukprot:s639_g5.t1
MSFSVFPNNSSEPKSDPWDEDLDVDSSGEKTEPDGQRVDPKAEESPAIPGQLSFDEVDLEKGCTWNLQAGASLLKHPPPKSDVLQRYTIVSSSVTTDEFHLMSESLELLMIARRRPDKQCSIDFWLPLNECEQQAPPVPAFCMRYQKEGDEWLLVQSRCEGCAHRPFHLTCDFLGRGQQVARVQHSRRKVEKCSVHHVDLYVPPLRNDGRSSLWCPACTGKDLGSKTPLSVGGSCSPKGSPIKSPSFHLLPPEGADALQLQSKLPAWSQDLEGLILNFEDRSGLLSSPRNFILQHQGEVVMQHAQIAPNTWCLDFKSPLSVIQAFASAMSSIDWD